MFLFVEILERDYRYKYIMLLLPFHYLPVRLLCYQAVDFLFYIWTFQTLFWLIYYRYQF